MMTQSKLCFNLFGDQSLDTYQSLADFCRNGEPGIVAKTFMERAGAALRDEIEKLPRLERSRIPIFRSLYQLNENYRAQTLRHPGIDSALLCITQIAQYIDRAEKAPEDHVLNSHTINVGLCTGQFAAAAVSLAKNSSHLVPVGVQTVLLVFRLGSHVASLANKLAPVEISEKSESWTCIVANVNGEQAKEALAKFHAEYSIPNASKAYVSAISAANVAISGQPSTLAKIQSSGVFLTKLISIPVYGPYHAEHLHGKTDMDSILKLDSADAKKVFEGLEPRSSIVSPSSGELIKESNADDLFRSIASECLCEPLMFSKAMESCVDLVSAFEKSSECLIVPYGPTSVSNTLAHVIESKTGLIVKLRTSEIKRDSYQAHIGAHGNQLGREKLAIVGMAGRFPDAASHQALWDLLSQGLDVHRPVPPDRFPADSHVDPTGKTLNTSHTPFGCWIKEPGLFDPRFFNMSPREAYQTDPMQRMALTTAYEALEMSGYVPNRTPSTRLDRIGTFYGQTSDDWRELNAAQEVDTYYITGGVRAFGPGRINYHFGFSGPSLNIDTACSSSTAAFQVACTALWANECDTAIVGGLSCMTNSDIFAGLSRGQFLSKTGGCKTFDDGADGYCRADGCASIIVKRLEDAEADNDRILAVVLGTATNHSAEAISITHPHGPTQSALYRSILDQAGVDPLDIDYVEMHGTGTQAGDGTEMVSVTNVFAPADRKRPRDRPLYLGSVKANVGHGEAASGITAVCKVLLMMQHSTIPPHVGIKTKINHTFPADLSERSVNIAYHMTPFKRSDGGLRRVFINNFSAAGGNTGILMEDAPRHEPAAWDPRSTHVISVTAKAKSSMLRNADNLIEFMKANPNTPLSHIAYSTTARRIQHYWRMSVAASSVPEAIELLQAKTKQEFTPVSAKQPNVAFLFTGQGSHYAALGKSLYENHAIFRSAIDEFNQLSEIHGFPSFFPLIDGSEPDVTRLSPVVVQTGLCAFEMALSRLWASWGVTPSVVLGHSLGEYAALYAAGVLSASDTLYLVGNRARLLVTKIPAGTHAMVAVQGSVPIVKEALGHRGAIVNIACINGPRETVISGSAEEMAVCARDLSAGGFKCTQLKVPYAFHSAQVEPILDEFEELAHAVTFKPAKISIISPLLGRVLSGKAITPKYLRDHAREAVDFLSGLNDAKSSELLDERTIWIEIGPHPINSNMVKATYGATTVAVPSLRRNEDAYKILSTSLSALHCAGLNINWDQYHHDFVPYLRMLDLPSYAFDLKNYWLQYTGDWLLHKGRNNTTAPTKALSAPKPTLSTTDVHTVTREEIKGNTVILETLTDLSRPDIRPVVEGHLCNGAALFPSTLYADICMTVADYTYRLLKPDAPKAIGMNVCKVDVPKTLILDEAKPQTLICSVVTDLDKNSAAIAFKTRSGKTETVHATCTVEYGDVEEYLDDFDKVNYLIKSRIDYLMEAESKGKASKVSRGLAYKLFQALVDYSPKYRGMEEVILDSKACEATAKVVFQTTPEDGNFYFNPYWIDSLCHISGFICNGSDAIDSRNEVFISHGWGSLRLPEKLDPSKSYRSYIRMQQVKDSKVMAGDCYIFDGDRIVGLCKDLRFQCIPRKVMNIMLPPRGATAAPVRATPMTSAPAVSKNQVTPKNIKTVNTGLQSKPKPKPKPKSVASRILDILAREVGVSHDELADNIDFADLGVDSLMGLTVAGCIREDLDIDIDSHVFQDHSTIGKFKEFLKKYETEDVDFGSGEEESEDCSEDDSTSDAESAVTTPMDSGDEESSEDIQKAFRQIISREMSLDLDEIIAAPDLAALGMDSLMTLTILGQLREVTGVDYPSDVFTEHTTLEGVEKVLGIAPQPKKVKAPAALKSAKASKPSTPSVSSSTVVMPKVRPPTVINTHPGNTTATIYKPPRPTEFVDHYPHRKSMSLMLQGSSRTAKRNLFMTPDGSGSATSYTEIGSISRDWAVYGLFCPFMTTPHEFTCGVYGVATKFIEEMRRRQPKGPYALAGWSAGGVIAFEMVNQLIKMGEEVDHLILLDSPAPVIIEPLPRTLHAWFAEIGILGEDDPKSGTKKVPEWLLPHFAAAVNSLANYTPERIPDDKCPKVTIIWCEHGVCKEPTDPRPEPYPSGHALFLLENRVDFGPNRWDECLNWEKITCYHLPGNHFTMMHGDLAKHLGKLMRKGLEA